MTTLLDHFTAEQASRLRPHLRTTFVPRIEEGAAHGPVSKIAGSPWLPDGVAWPSCPNCEQAMQLLVQLDLDSLPEHAPSHGPGLAQLFYCTSSEPLCEVDCQAFFPFAKSCVTRIVDGHAPGRDAEARTVPNALAPKRIVGWTPEEDLPGFEELREVLGVEVAYDDPLYHALHASERPLANDKLRGWPHWVQSVEYPACPECKEPMGLLFQIDSNDQVGWQWGDLGCAHWCQCAKHPGQMAFGWACG
jgi:hypothetical protein